MKRKRSKNDFPQRVFAFYLLFSLLGLISSIIGIFHVCQNGQHARQESHRRDLVLAQQAKLAIALQRNEMEQLKELCERFGREGDINTCSVYDLDGKCLASSDPDRIGRMREYRQGNVQVDGDIERLDVADADLDIVEYSIDLGRKNIRGTYVAEFKRPIPWITMADFGPLVLVVVCLPLAIILAGGVFIRHKISDVGKIHTQLVQFAAEPSLQSASFEPVPARNAVSVGWNALVRELGDPEERPNLQERLLNVVKSRKSDRHESAVDSLPDGIAETDIDGQLTFINNAMAALLGEEDKDRLIGTSLEQWFDPDVAEEIRQLFDEECLSRQVVKEITKPTPYGEQVLRIGKYPIAPNSNDPRAGQAWTLRDVTQQKLAERARDEFLDSATHELRTPLANIKAYAETLTLSEMTDVEQQKEFCNIINSEATRLARFIDELLDVSSIEAGSLHGTMQKVELDRLLEDVVTKVRPLMQQKDIELEVSFSDKLPELSLDKEKFSTCLVNLLGNAAKYTPNGGHVIFKAHVTEDQLAISVSDNGIGIAEEDLPRIFDKFFRANDERVHQEVGTGLGLAFVSEVAKLHDARLNVESQLNEGTTFTLQLNVPSEAKNV